MREFLYNIVFYYKTIFRGEDWYIPIFRFFPIVLILELPFYILTVTFAVRGWLKIHYAGETKQTCYPLVSVIVTAYNETMAEIDMSLKSIMEQIYPGTIEVFVIIDNASQNKATVRSVHTLRQQYQGIKNRSIQVIAKLTRGGHASSNNLGLKLAKGVMLMMIDADTSIDNVSVLKAVKHFEDENVIGVSGGVRVRNYRDSIITRLQAIEYMLGIQLGRFGLTEANAINTISGAFSIYRRSFIKQIGGWLNGSGEDLDMVLRIHAYTSRHAHLKIVNEPEAIAWTNAPDRVRKLFKQRSRWDGDIYYIYIRRHWKKFSNKSMGGAKLFLTTWYALLYQLILPFVMMVYFVYMGLMYPAAELIIIGLLLYYYYLGITFFMYALFLLLVSERPKKDLRFIGWLFLMPFYQQMMRFVSGFYILNEIIFKTHKDSSMAPWWVIKKTK